METQRYLQEIFTVQIMRNFYRTFTFPLRSEYVSEVFKNEKEKKRKKKRNRNPTTFISP